MIAWQCVGVIVLTTIQSAPSSPAPPPSEPAPVAPATGESDADLLAGPAVADAPSKLTIVQRNFDGTLQEIDPEPDITAINILPLNETQRQKMLETLKERYAAFDEIVRKNYGLILELSSIQGRAATESTLELLEKTRSAFQGYISRGSFLDEMKPYLDEKQIAQVTAMLDEYRQARLAELRNALGENATLRQIGTRARLESFGQMIRQSIERQIGLARETFDQIAEELTLTDDQRRRAEAMLQPLAVKQFQRIDTPADRAEAFRKFRELLTPEQAAKLLDLVIRQWSPESDAAPANGVSTD
jgi:hypothetical protein